jgi:hypothetical protein
MAGLEADAWSDPETQLLAFTAEVFSEKEFRPARMGAAPGRSPSEESEVSG